MNGKLHLLDYLFERDFEACISEIEALEKAKTGADRHFFTKYS